MASAGLIVVGVDGSSGGRRALYWALDHAADSGATVHVVTAYAAADPAPAGSGSASERRGIEATQESDIEAACAGREIIPDLVHQVRAGDAVAVLTNAARSADMLVVGSHGHGHLRTALMGSVSQGCIRRGTCPVVVVPTPALPLRQRTRELAHGHLRWSPWRGPTDRPDGPTLMVRQA